MAYYNKLQMGIPSYFSYIVKSHRNIIKKINAFSKFDNFYIDSNSIIYDSIHEIKENFNSFNEFENKLLSVVCEKISKYIDLISPSQRVFIAFDGVAPVAKLNQQRNRRYKSWFQGELLKSINNDQSESWNTSAITPGTTFMEKLRNKVHGYFNDSKKFNLDIMIISCSDEPGEGEHKIYDYIRKHSQYHKTTKTVIYGLDADLFMLTLCNLHVTKQMYLFRETPQFIKSIDNTLNPNELYVLDIPLLGNAIINDMYVVKNTPNTENTNLLFDYILICFMLGNDFLPHFPSINIRTNGINILLEAYKNVFKSNESNLTNGKQIIWKNLRKFIEYLNINDYKNFKSEMSQRDKLEKRQPEYKTLQEKIDNIPIKEREIEKYISQEDEGFEYRYYKTLFDMNIDDKRKNQICINYLEGLEWTFKYYTQGCPNWRWCYKYNYPPLLSDLIRYIPYFETDLICRDDKLNITEKMQLCYVLPKNSLYLLPKDIHDKLLAGHSEWYNNDCEVQWAFCKYFWEAHVVLPEIDIDELEGFLQG